MQDFEGEIIEVTSGIHIIKIFCFEQFLMTHSLAETKHAPFLLPQGFSCNKAWKDIKSDFMGYVEKS